MINTLDAMISERAYRQGAPFDVAKTEIVRMKGSQFDPKAVDAFSAEEAVLRDMANAKCHSARHSNGLLRKPMRYHALLPGIAEYGGLHSRSPRKVDRWFAAACIDKRPALTPFTNI